MQTLVEIVFDLDPLRRDHLSAIRITRRPEGYRAELRLLLFSRVSEPGVPLDSERLYQLLTADGRVLRPGDKVPGIEHWPDIIVHLNPATPPETQIEELETSGLVGDLECARFRSAGGRLTVKWIIRTHAGSETDRAAWVLALATPPRDE
jgi:hypothetical protein